MMLKQFVRGVQLATAKPQQIRMVQSINQHYFNQYNTISLVNQQQRLFAKKKKGGKGKKSGSETPTEDEAEPSIMDTIKELRGNAAEAAPTPVEAAPTPAEAAPTPEPTPEPTPAPPKPKMTSGGAGFSVGPDVKVIQSAPGNKPPSSDDSIEGRYSGVLFTTASMQESLFSVYEDMVYLGEIYNNSETFRMFTQNGGVGRIEINKFNQSLQEMADFNPLTIKFLEVLAENKRLYAIDGIIKRYVKLYQQFHKEEKITIISATQLSGSEEAEVLAALQTNPHNEGKQFQLEFTIDESIKGGLQMYTETEFMDMSLSSRLVKLEQELGRLAE